MGKKKIRKPWGWLVVDEDHVETEGKLAEVLASRKFPLSRVAGSHPDTLAGRVKKWKEDLKAAPPNLARGLRTREQQDKVYGKVFEHNSLAQKRSRRRQSIEKKGEARMEFVGQIPREALMEESQAAGKPVSDIVKDSDHLNHIAEKKGYLHK